MPDADAFLLIYTLLESQETHPALYTSIGMRCPPLVYFRACVVVQNMEHAVLCIRLFTYMPERQ